MDFEAKVLDRQFKRLYSARYELDEAARAFLLLQQLSPASAKPASFLIETLFVQNSQRKQGLASALVARICALADRERAELYLKPSPLDEGISQSYLELFYGRFGFMPFRDGLWLRLPQRAQEHILQSEA